MAYVFNRTLNLMGQGEPEKQDVFRTAETGAPQVAQPSTGNIKTSVEGAISTQAPSTGSGAQQALQRSSLVAPKSDVIKQNIGKVQAPRAAGEAISGIKAAGEGLQAEADAYTAGAQTYAAPDAEVLKKGTTGSQSDFSAISDLLQKNITTTEAFKPKTDYQIEQAAELSSPAGIQRTLQREGDEEYTKGMGAFDLSLLGQSPEFAQTMEAVSRGQKELTGQADKALKELPEQRLGKEQESLKTAQEATKTALGDLSKGITESATKKEKDYDNQLAYYAGEYTPTPAEQAKWDKERDDFIGKAYQDAVKDISGMYAGADYGKYMTPDYAKMLNPADYIDYGMTGDDTDYTQFLSPDDVSQFNTIMGLLGQGTVVNKGLPLGSMFGLDRAGLEAAMVANAIKGKDQYEASKAFNEAGGLEQGFEKPKSTPAEPYTMAPPGSLAIPSIDYAPTAPVGGGSLVKTATYEGDFPSIGSLMIPAGEPGYGGGTIKSSNAKTKYNPRGI